MNIFSYICFQFVVIQVLYSGIIYNVNCNESVCSILYCSTCKKSFTQQLVTTYLTILFFHLKVTSKENSCFEHSETHLCMIPFNLEWSPKQIRNCLFVFLFSLNSQFPLLPVEEEGGNSKHKKPTCFIITVHMKFNVLIYLNQLSFVLYNYS